MSVYKYIADNDPQGSAMIIDSFGYQITDRSNLGKSLSELVSNVGEPALRKVMDLHPDKDIILEFYSNGESKNQGSCQCSSCKSRFGHDNYLNASGTETPASTTQNSNTLAHQTNTILIVATLFVVTALILNKK